MEEHAHTCLRIRVSESWRFLQSHFRAFLDERTGDLGLSLLFVKVYANFLSLHLLKTYSSFVGHLD